MSLKTVSIKIAATHPPGSLGHLSTTFIINGKIAVDAGAIASSLTLKEQRRIRHLLLTHAHLDHLHELPQFLDHVQAGGRSGSRRRPVIIHAEEATLRPLRSHLFGGLWPDVLDPAIGFATARPFDLEKRPLLRLGGFSIRPLRTLHRVPAVGYRFERNKQSFAILEDTGFQEGLLDTLLKAPRLRFLAIEVSYPNRLERWAVDHGHLTPAQLHRLVDPQARRHPGLLVLIHHLKPAFAEETAREIGRLRLEGVRFRIARNGDHFSYKF